MDGSRLFGGKLPINRSRPLVRNTAFNPLSPITSCAEVNACRTSELIMVASSRVVMLPPVKWRVPQKYTRDIARPCGQIPFSDKDLKKHCCHFVYSHLIV